MMFELDQSDQLEKVGIKIVETCNEISLSSINVRLGMFQGYDKKTMEDYISKKKVDLNKLYREQQRLRELK